MCDGVRYTLTLLFMEREYRTRDEVLSAKDYICYCTDCGMTLAEHLPLCMAQEAAQYHQEDTGHAVYLFREGELHVYERSSRDE